MEAMIKTKEVGKPLPKPNNIVMVPTEKSEDFFKLWCTFLKPFVTLTPKEIEIVSAFLEERAKLYDKISDPELVDTLLMGKEVKNRIIEKCNITVSHFYVVINILRKKKVFLENGINPRLVPNIRKDDNGMFQLLVLFKSPNKNES